jgi:hypothetical protein
MARFDAIEKELIQMSKKTMFRRYHEMEESSGDNENLLKQVLVTETPNHHESNQRMMTLLYQIQRGVDF